MPRRVALLALWLLAVLVALSCGCAAMEEHPPDPQTAAAAKATGATVGATVGGVPGAVIGEILGWLAASIAAVYAAKKHGDAKTERARAMPPRLAMADEPIGSP